MQVVATVAAAAVYIRVHVKRPNVDTCDNHSTLQKCQLQEITLEFIHVHENM